MNMEEKDLIQEQLKFLKGKLKFVDKLAKVNSGERETKYLVFTHEVVKLRIDANLNHSRPHIHLDCGSHFHSASIAIDKIEILVGNIPAKYYKTIIEWVTKNQDLLNRIWIALKNSQNPDNFKLQLVG